MSYLLHLFCYINKIFCLYLYFLFFCLIVQNNLVVIDLRNFFGSTLESNHNIIKRFYLFNLLLFFILIILRPYELTFLIIKMLINILNMKFF